MFRQKDIPCTVYLIEYQYGNSWAYKSKWNSHVWQNLPPAPCGNGIDLYRD